MLARCEHGVYSPDGDGQPSVYCSGCFSPLSPAVPKGFGDAYDDEFEHDDLIKDLIANLPYGSDACPRCDNPLAVKSEEDISCPTCGFEV